MEEGAGESFSDHGIGGHIYVQYEKASVSIIQVLLSLVVLQQFRYYSAFTETSSEPLSEHREKNTLNKECNFG